MQSVLEQIPTSEPVDQKRPYFPLPAALARGAVDLTNKTVTALRDPLGVILSAGHMPRHDEAGMVETSAGPMAVDHSSLIKLDSTGLEVAPSSKDDVAKKDGEIKASGTLTLTSPDGLLRIIGVAIDQVKHPWLAERLNAVGAVGKTAIALFGLEAADYEVTDIDSKTGIIIARPRRYVK